MADMITRCPKCGTAFRISDALLKSAKGVVRCGSCLSVFNAREHLEGGKSAAPVERTPRPPVAQPPRSTPPSATSAPPPPAPPPPAQAKTPPPSFAPPETPVVEEDDDVDMPEWRRRSGADEGYSAADFRSEPELDDEDDDEAWALELLKDDDDLNVQFKKVTPKPAGTSPANPQESNFAAKEDLPASPPPAEIHNTFAEIDEQLAPLEPDSTPDTHAEIPTPVTDTPAVTNEEEPYHAESRSSEAAELYQAREEPDAAEEEEPEPPPEPPKRKPIRPKLEPKSTPLKDVIASLEPEPLEVDWQEPGAWRRRLLWPLLALVALLCLLAQVAWLEFDRLSRVEPYRSAYGIVCGVIGCQLPELLDRSQIQTSNLLVRSHPEVADALQVDVILQNNAPFEQTFPVLELTFTNLRSEPVATRRLDPADYLGGELAGRDKMPVRQPIHIALEIADPGSEAVSYHITIVD